MAADDFIKGLLVGGLISAAFAVVCTPRSGKETREEIRDSVEELLGRAKCQYGEAYRKIETLADHEKQSIIGTKERLKKAFEAGVEAFKQEKTGTLQA